jgi:hypothetical protein
MLPKTTTIPRPLGWEHPKAPGDEERRLYFISYLWIRVLVGALGLLLPIVLIAGEWLVLDEKVDVRGSLSSYYHSSMGDFFVGCLCVIGFLLITYMIGRYTWDFVLSTIAGAAVVCVAFIPTERSNPRDLPDGAEWPLCGADPKPSGCTDLQQRFGEEAVGDVHAFAAAVFLTTLVAISILFGWRETHRTDGRPPKPYVALTHYICAGLIAASLLLILAGYLWDFDLGELTPLYVGEVVAVAALATSWVVKGGDQWGGFGLGAPAGPAPAA